MPRPADTKPRRERDPRLDFFRGLGLFIIFIAHIRDNPWNDWIPPRFGFSDTTEMFVFCSGMASAIAFGRLYDKAGFWLATARIVQRLWQVYWAHIAVLLASISVLTGLDRWLGRNGQLLEYTSFKEMLTHDAATGLFAYMTLTYQPEYFDILPLYLVILSLLPVMMAMSRIGPGPVLAFMIALWIGGQAGLMRLPANPWGNESWYFNPLCWQLIFFAGFGFMRGWWPAPPVDNRLIWLAVAILLLVVPLAWTPLVDNSPELTAIRIAVWSGIEKTNFGLLRFAHFLAMAYLAYVASGPGGSNIRGSMAQVVATVGQQTLAVFVAGIVLSQIGGVIVHEAGRGWQVTAAMNLAGFAFLIAVAYLVGWIKSAPWQSRGAQQVP
jgi:hypothetical protein